MIIIKDKEEFLRLHKNFCKQKLWSKIPISNIPSKFYDYIKAKQKETDNQNEEIEDNEELFNDIADRVLGRRKYNFKKNNK